MPTKLVLIECDYCGEFFHKRKADIKRTRGNYCDRKCLGQHRAQRNREAFFRKSKEVNGCWEWQGGKSSHGYGKVRFNGKAMLAHRVSCLLVGRDPGPLFVCHRCDNPACVNPNHLFLGTCKDNMQDMWGKASDSFMPLPTPPETAPVSTEEEA